MSTATKRSERHATREEWAAIRSKVSPGNLRDFDAGAMPIYEDHEGTKRLLPPKGLTTFDVAPNGRISRSAPTAATRPEPQASSRTASDDVLDEVTKLGADPRSADDAVMGEIERTFGAADARPTTARTTASTSVDGDVLEEVTKLGASADESALDEVAVLGRAVR